MKEFCLFHLKKAIGASMMHQFVTPSKTIISHLSFTHLREIMTLDDPLARYFYEQECIKCTWSVRELRRQISTNLFVRAGISANPENSPAWITTSSFLPICCNCPTKRRLRIFCWSSWRKNIELVDKWKIPSLSIAERGDCNRFL